jgi:hypothetical protein
MMALAGVQDASGFHIVFCQRTVAALPGPLLDKQPGVGRKSWQKGRNCGKWLFKDGSHFR